MVEVDEATSNLMAQKRDCASSGQDAPAEDIAKRLFVSEKMVEVDETSSNLMAQKRDCASSGQDAPAEDIAKRLFVSEEMVEGVGFEPTYA